MFLNSIFQIGTRIAVADVVALIAAGGDSLDLAVVMTVLEAAAVAGDNADDDCGAVVLVVDDGDVADDAHYVDAGVAAEAVVDAVVALVFLDSVVEVDAEIAAAVADVDDKNAEENATAAGL